MLDTELRQKIDQAFENRLKVMATIYKHQGDTSFYRRMLDSNAGLFSQVLGQAAGDAKVSHEDVLTYLGQASMPVEPTIVQSDSTPAFVDEVEEEDWEDEPLEPQVDQSRVDNGIEIFLGKKYLISLDRLDADGRKELRKTPDYDRRAGVGKVVTITGWDDSWPPFWSAIGIDEEGETRSIVPLYLVEVNP